MSDTRTHEAHEALDALGVVARRSIAIMADGDFDDFAAVVHPDAANREARA